jgi:hypothetical protein
MGKMGASNAIYTISPRVETAKALLLSNTSETTKQAIGERGLGDKTDTSSLQRAKGDIGEELGDG